jgi:hypothetical protein
VRLNGVRLNGVRLNGTLLNGVRLNGSELAGSSSTGAPVSGAGMVGATLEGTLSDGTVLQMRVDSAATLPAPDSDVWEYGVSYLSDSAWQPLCDTTPATAVAVAGVWNYGEGVPGGGSWSNDGTSFTFGCRTTAIAKCVEMGYKPWKTVSGVNLTDHHVACTRMIRADYCGDGRAWTIDGNAINVWDWLDIQVDTENWPTDAEWTTAGARCFMSTRTVWVLGKPDCNRGARVCGGRRAMLPTGGTLMVSEYHP